MLILKKIKNKKNIILIYFKIKIILKNNGYSNKDLLRLLTFKLFCGAVLVGDVKVLSPHSPLTGR